MIRSRIIFAGRPDKERVRRVRAMLLKWRSRLLVEDWTLTVTFHPKPLGTDSERHLAHVDVSERYKSGRVHVYPPMWEEPAIEQERTLVHEMIHAPINRVGNILDRAVKAGIATAEEVDDAYEELTEHFTNVVWDAYDGR